MERETRRVERMALAAGIPGLDFKPIRQLRAHEYVADQIRRHVALRIIKPGEALPPERELAVTFGVGRPTIQHALRILEADGLVSARRGRRGGTFVCGENSDGTREDDLVIRVVRRRGQLEDLLMYRRVVEPAVAGIAAETRRRADLTAMRKAIRGMTGAASESDYMRFDTEFHLAIARATRNRYLAAAVENIRMELNDAITLLPESDAWHGRIAAEHQEILEAMEGGNSSKAATVMEMHVRMSEQGLRAVLNAIGRRRLMQSAQ